MPQLFSVLARLQIGEGRPLQANIRGLWINGCEACERYSPLAPQIQRCLCCRYHHQIKQATSQTVSSEFGLQDEVKEMGLCVCVCEPVQSRDRSDVVIRLAACLLWRTFLCSLNWSQFCGFSIWCLIGSWVWSLGLRGTEFLLSLECQGWNTWMIAIKGHRWGGNNFDCSTSFKKISLFVSKSDRRRMVCIRCVPRAVHLAACFSLWERNCPSRGHLACSPPPRRKCLPAQTTRCYERHYWSRPSAHREIGKKWADTFWPDRVIWFSCSSRMYLLKKQSEVKSCTPRYARLFLSA